MWKGFQKPKRLTVDGDSLTEAYGRFSAQPFERGFGVTIGNSVRRALLSSIEGAAITAVKIKGVTQDPSPIAGVSEDVTDLILNLKQIPLRLHGDEPATLKLVANAAGEVTSGQIEENSQVSVLDPNVYLATVEKGGSLEIEMRVKLGRGYVSSEKNFDEDLDLGYIPIDSVHSPVRKVNLVVDQARLGQMTDYDKISLEIWTNGSITPQEAVTASAGVFRDLMIVFINFEEEAVLEESAGDTDADRYAEYLSRSVEELELSVRSYNCLKNANIQTIGDLISRSESDMLKTKNFGRKSLTEIREILGGMGLSLGMEFDSSGKLIVPEKAE